MGWLSQFFLNPSIAAAGAGLLAVPVLIHLINRWRYRRVRWAAMEFLLRSKQQNQRKLLLEQLLLLCLRTLAVAFIVAMLARPILDPGKLQMLQGQRSHHLILLDDSLSMQDRTGARSAFEEGLEMIRRIAREGTRRAGTQALTLLLASRPEQPLFTQVPVDSQFLDDLELRLEKVRCTHQQGDLLTALQGAVQQIQLPAASKSLHIISDFRARDWGETGVYSTLLSTLEQQKVSVNLWRAVDQQNQNLAVTALSGDVQVAAVNVPFRVSVTIKNFGNRPALNVGLTILQDGQQVPLNLVIPELKPSDEVTREFDVQFTTGGRHLLRVELAADALSGDNSRTLALNLADKLPVLVIAGNPSDSEAQFLADAIAPAQGLTGFAPVVESPNVLRRQSLDAFSSIYLVNVPELPTDTIRFLEDYVRGGGGLCWYVGSLVNASFYNEKLFQAGQGIFPAALGKITELKEDETNVAPDLAFEGHPLFKFFEGEENPFVADVTVRRFFSVVDEAKLPAQNRVIARLRNRAPLFMEQPLGQGRIIACLTSAGSAWTNWPQNPSYVLTQLELQKYLARRPSTTPEQLTGAPLRIALDPATYRNQVEIRTPDPQRIVRLNLVPAPTTNSSNSTPLLREDFAETDLPGIYSILQFRQNDTSETQVFTYHVPIGESDLALAGTEQLRSAAGTSQMRIHSLGEFDWNQERFSGQELRDLLWIVLAAILIGEQLLAWKMSYHPPQEVPA